MSSNKEQLRKAVFGRLRSLRRKLSAQGIPCAYARSVLSHDDGENGYRITYHVGNNGDATLLPQISIRTGEAIEEFDSTNFEQGLGRLRELFHVEA